MAAASLACGCSGLCQRLDRQRRSRVLRAHRLHARSPESAPKRQIVRSCSGRRRPAPLGLDESPASLHALDAPGARRAQRQLHLHGFHDQHFVAFCDFVADFRLDQHDRGPASARRCDRRCSLRRVAYANAGACVKTWRRSPSCTLMRSPSISTRQRRVGAVDRRAQPRRRRACADRLRASRRRASAE